MKIRKRLVSNSSSSSFIITHSNIKDITLAMYGEVTIDCRDDEEIKKRTKYLSDLCDQESVKTGKVGVMFPSCNFNTYIIRDDQRIVISSSRNHDFDNCWPEDASVLDGGEDGSTYDEIRDFLGNKFFHTIMGDQPTIDYNWHYIENDEDDINDGDHYHKDEGIRFLCPICAERKYETSPVNYYRLGQDGNKYCPWHFVKMDKVKVETEGISLKEAVENNKEE